MSNKIFIQPYNRESYINFLQHQLLPDDFKQEQTNILVPDNTKYILSAVKLGESKSLDLVVYEIKHAGKNDPRVRLSKEAFRLLANEWRNRALILFVPKDNNDNYRLSLIEIELIGNPENAKIERKYSNPRRYSYFLGKNIGGYTPEKYLSFKGRIINEKDLFERFSVEILTKAFYNELSDWYAWAVM